MSFPLISLCLALLCAFAGAQPERDGFLVRIWQSDEGLPGNVVRSIGQSADGFLWIATAEGIARFDGIGFEHVVAVGTEDGRPLDLFRIFTPQDGSVWVATNRQGLLRVGLEGMEEVVADYADANSGLITRLFTHGGETFVFRNDKWWSLDRSEVVEEMSPELAAARDECIRTSRNRGRSDDGVGARELVDRVGGVWSFDSSGPLYREPGQTEPVSVQELEGVSTASDMLEDREGNLWIARPPQGLLRIRHSRVRRVSVGDGYYDAAALTCLKEPDGTWWIANRNGGLDFVRDGVRGHVPIVTSEVRAVSCLHRDRHGDLWVGTSGGSVFVLNRDLEKVRSRLVNGPNVSQVSSITEDSKGRLWFAGRRGIFRLDGDEVEDFSGCPGAENAEFSSLALDHQDKLYVGTEAGRVMRLEDGKFLPLDGPGGERMRWISAIVPRDDGEVWVSTLGTGLFCWKAGKWYEFGVASGLPDLRLTGLISGEDDSFWMGSLGGIIRVSHLDLLHRIADEDFSISWLTLDRTDGMVTRECSGGAQPGIFKDADGTLWFPTNVGLAGVDQGRIAINRVPPTVHFRPVEIDGVPHAPKDSTIIAGPGRVSLAFQFLGLNLSAPEKVSYRVQLAGLDQHSRHIGNENSVDYQAVPPGNYTLQVTAINGDGSDRQRGHFQLAGIRGMDDKHAYTVGFDNPTAQYWVEASEGSGEARLSGIKPGSYRVRIYKGELAVYEGKVNIKAGAVSRMDEVILRDDPSMVTPLWRIGDWDGTPMEFRNGEKISLMHPSDPRMDDWEQDEFVVGKSEDADFPSCQWMDVNGGREVKFWLDDGQIKARKVRVGITAAFAGCRPRVSLNGWSAGIPKPSSQPRSRSFTIGTYRSNNQIYTFDVPASAFRLGENTLGISPVSGQKGSGFLSPGYTIDCVDLH